MYLGKLRKRSVPRSAMSNMLWWLETTTYDRPGTNPGACSTARRTPHRRKAATSATWSVPATYSCGRWPKRRAIRCAGSKTSRMAAKTGRKAAVPAQERILFTVRPLPERGTVLRAGACGQARGGWLVDGQRFCPPSSGQRFCPPSGMKRDGADERGAVEAMGRGGAADGGEADDGGGGTCA